MITTKPLYKATALLACSSLLLGSDRIMANTMLEQAPPWEVSASAGVSNAANANTNTPSIRTRSAPANMSPFQKAIKAAQEGNPQAQYDVAVMYHLGQGTEKNIAQAMYWFTLAAQNGEPNAQYRLAVLYRSGEAGAQDQPRSLHWLNAAAERGQVDAQYALGQVYQKGIGVSPDAGKATAWFRKAAQGGHALAKQALAVNIPPAAAPMPAMMPHLAPVPLPVSNPQMSRQVQRQADAIEDSKVNLDGMNPNDILELAHTEDRYAQFLVGAMYEDGSNGFSQNYREAARWYRRSAKQNYAKAQYNLALLYEDGRGVSQDYLQAGQWYSQAAKSGFSKAKNNLGILYILGKGVRKSTEKATTLFQQAANEGDQDAIRNLARLREKQGG